MILVPEIFFLDDPVTFGRYSQIPLGKGDGTGVRRLTEGALSMSVSQQPELPHKARLVSLHQSKLSAGAVRVTALLCWLPCNACVEAHNYFSVDRNC